MAYLLLDLETLATVCSHFWQFVSEQRIDPAMMSAQAYPNAHTELIVGLGI